MTEEARLETISPKRPEYSNSLLLLVYPYNLPRALLAFLGFLIYGAFFSPFLSPFSMFSLFKFPKYKYYIR